MVLNNTLAHLPIITLLNLSTIAYTKQWNTTGYSTFYVSKESTKYHPLFCILNDKDDLFIVIRGSNNDADFDSMLDDAEIVTSHGIYHHGYYKAALNTLSKIVPVTGSTKGKVYITGHSYGASIAVILYNLLMNLPDSVIPNKDNIYAVGFASLPTSNYVSNSTNMDHVFTIGHVDDVFMRLSKPNVYNTLNNMNNGYITSKYQSSLDLSELINSYRTKGVPSGSFIQSFLLRYIPILVDEAHSINDGHKFKLVRTPGTVILLGRNCTIFSDCICDPKDFPDSLPTSKEGIYVHTPLPIMDELSKLDW